MDGLPVKQIVEGAILAAETPLSVDQLMQLFEENASPERSEIREALKEIEQECEDRGYELKKVASGYRFQVKAKYGEQSAGYQQYLSEKREDVAEVGVRPGCLVVVVELVHVRRYEDITQQPVDARRQANIGVGEVAEEGRNHAVDEVVDGGNAEHQDDCHRRHESHDQVAGVVPGAGCCVDVGIGVVHKV